MPHRQIPQPPLIPNPMYRTPRQPLMKLRLAPAPRTREIVRSGGREIEKSLSRPHVFGRRRRDARAPRPHAHARMRKRGGRAPGVRRPRRRNLARFLDLLPSSLATAHTQSGVSHSPQASSRIVPPSRRTIRPAQSRHGTMVRSTAVLLAGLLSPGVATSAALLNTPRAAIPTLTVRVMSGSISPGFGGVAGGIW